MRKLTFEEKQARKKQKWVDQLNAKPVLGMAHYKMGDIATLRLQIVKLTRKTVVMKTIRGTGTITLSTTDGSDIESLIKIERIPCSIVPTLTKNGETIEIPQGTECNL